jgi:hypothetical protein
MIKQNRSSFWVSLPYSEPVRKKCTRAHEHCYAFSLLVAKNGNQSRKKIDIFSRMEADYPNKLMGTEN